jgi:hypothetical protein
VGGSTLKTSWFHKEKVYWSALHSASSYPYGSDDRERATQRAYRALGDMYPTWPEDRLTDKLQNDMLYGKRTY